MKFKFKVQPYQTAAAKAVTDVFEGQPNTGSSLYTRDMGTFATPRLMDGRNNELWLSQSDAGYGNGRIQIDDKKLLENIRHVQQVGCIEESPSLSHDIGAVQLDVEMETGTGKTYVYTKTMFELNRLYGWSKFIIVVPSIAIREGVNLSLAATQQHFFEQYGKTIHHFVYNSGRLNELDHYAQDSGINAMIINMQAFNASMKAGGTSKKARIMYSERDEFGSRRPIDVIAATNPIVIVDEPQRISGEATIRGIKQFHPLFCLNYSATHKEKHNCVYRLDALDAYNERLVKRIEVKGFELKNLRGTDGYLYLQDVVVSRNHEPQAVIEYKAMGASGHVTKRTSRFDTGDSIYEASGSQGLEAYQGFTIAPDGIVPDLDGHVATVRFLNGVVLKKGEVYGDSSLDDMRRVQIRETIRSHLEKEEALYSRGIKCLSLFFIDEVAKYRQYDEDGHELTVGYGKVFEEEYEREVQKYLERLIINPQYKAYLQSINVHDTHRGYFSVDKKGHAVDSEFKRNYDGSDDESAYDLILKNKERLLSFEEPCRFIFSHSALREGWDNPNVFQICTLKHSDSETGKRQEVGRGLRLCVNKNGDRQDAAALGDDEVQAVNLLTVVASESYASFTDALQKDISSTLHDRPANVEADFFKGRTFTTADGWTVTFDVVESKKAYFALVKGDLIDMDGRPTQKFHEQGLKGAEDLFPEELKKMMPAVEALVKSVYDSSALDGMISDGNKRKVTDNAVNDNWNKKEFQELWRQINAKHSYTVQFDQEELRRNAIRRIDHDLRVSEASYVISQGSQMEEAHKADLDAKAHFKKTMTRTEAVTLADESVVTYDLLGEISKGASITRRSAAHILAGIRPDTFELYRKNPEEFIAKTSKLILEEKATMVVEHISYHRAQGEYGQEIFCERMPKDVSGALEVQKSVQDYVFTDSKGEREFTEDLETSDEVVVYARLPRGFKIPTPVGNYAPDWAIAFKRGSVQHVFFIAETKGSLDSMELRGVEKAKIACAKKLFNEMSRSDVRYDVVKNYDDLMQVVKGQ